MVEKKEYIERGNALLSIMQNGTDAGTVGVVMKLPAADVSPVVHGKWIFDDDQWSFRCTECHEWIGNTVKYKYCPYCGAKMDLL